MKISPLTLTLDNNLDLNKRFYFISGSEKTYIEKIKQIIISNYKSKKALDVENIKNINLYQKEQGLFSDHKIYIVDEILKTTEEEIKKASSSGDDIFIFIFENSPKIKSIKNIFIKRKDSWVIDCYELTKQDKKVILNNWLQNTGLKLEDSLYWWLLDGLDERYVFLDKTLEKIEKLKKEDFNKDNLYKIISYKTHGLDKIFFEVLSSNERLIDLYNKKISNLSDVGGFYYTFKQYCFLIINSDNESDFSTNIPKYLFRERDYLIKLYKKYNVNKKNKLLKLLLKTETSFRKNGDLSIMIGLRFLLNFRRLTIS